LIEVTRGAAELPYEIQKPPEDSWLEVETTKIGKSLAVLLRAKPGQAGPEAIYLADGNVVTVVTGDGADFADLWKLAESIASQ
jgi:hypothetical protein